MTHTRDEILGAFALFSGGTGGIDNWLNEDTAGEVLERLARIDVEPLSKVQLDQLLLLSHEAGVTDGFFRYYWLETPDAHTYDVTKLGEYDSSWLSEPTTAIRGLNHLRWGLYRLYVDSLLYFGNIRAGYRALRSKDAVGLRTFFSSRRIDTAAVSARGPALELRPIPRDDRYLISEMACKSYAPAAGTEGLREILLSSLEAAREAGKSRVTIRELVSGEFVRDKYAGVQDQLELSTDAILDEAVESPDQLEEKVRAVAAVFESARASALANTRYYLSMVGDLDVYVATSMRSRDDFRKMADLCERVFRDPVLADLELRYFDPTLSAAEGHEDKGLIECLMVKASKLLIYQAGEKESYGKDAEAAMALSQGKPVIFYCDAAKKADFYKKVHPLSRLIDFATGVAVGAYVATTPEEVVELVRRVFHNDHEYVLEQSRPGYFRLKDRLTDSVIRLQTNDDLLRETFWNYYNSDTVNAGH